MTPTDKEWESFEDVFRAVLDRHKDFFELEEVEPGPKEVTGKARKVRPWDIEVVGYRRGSRRLVLFECKHRSRNVEPEAAGGFAYRIEDTGAETGYFVTPLDKRLGKGAREIADYEQIGHVQLARNSTPDDYTMKFLDNMFIGVSETIHCNDVASVIIRHADGTEIEKEFGSGLGRA
jgi:hypothetical protein